MVNPTSKTRIGVCSWSLRPENAGDLIKGLQRLGIRAVQLALNPIIDNQEGWQEAITLLRSSGVRIMSGMIAMAGEDYSTLESIRRTGGVRPDDTWTVNETLARAAARLAAAERIELVTFHAGFLPEAHHDPQRAVMIGRLRTIADLFADAGAAVALETGQETAETLANVVDEIDRPNLGVNFDPANMILYGMGDPVASITQLAGRVRQIHIKDALPADGPGCWGREMPAGQGAVDWPAFFAVSERVDPSVNYVIEREAGPDRDADIAAARELVEVHLSERRSAISD